jgi:membrane protein DedA with SNARE-associated domain
MFSSLLQLLTFNWRYVAIAAGTFVEGEAVLIAAGTLAQHGALSYSLVWLAGCVGSIAWSQCWFQIGRKLGTRVLERHPAWRASQPWLFRWSSRSDTVVVLFFRFVAGMGTFAPLFLGATGYAQRRYVRLDILAAALWALVFSAAGFGLSNELSQWLGRPIGVIELFGTGALLVFAAGGCTCILRRYVARRYGALPNVDVTPADGKVRG